MVVAWVAPDFHHRDCLGLGERLLAASLYRVVLVRDFPALAIPVSIVEHDPALMVLLGLEVQGVQEWYGLVWVEVCSTLPLFEPFVPLVYRWRISARFA